MPKEIMVAVTWYNCDCEWHTKYCDENHRSKALVPESVLKPFVKR